MFTANIAKNNNFTNKQLDILTSLSIRILDTLRDPNIGGITIKFPYSFEDPEVIDIVNYLKQEPFNFSCEVVDVWNGSFCELTINWDKNYTNLYCVNR